jgi:hypothetical protein
MQLTERSLRPISCKLGFMGFNFRVLDRSFMTLFLSTTLGYTIQRYSKFQLKVVHNIL